MMIRKYFKSLNQNNKQIFGGKLVKIGQIGHFSFFAKLACAESWPSISALNGHFTKPPGRLIILKMYKKFPDTLIATFLMKELKSKCFPNVWEQKFNTERKLLIISNN